MKNGPPEAGSAGKNSAADWPARQRLWLRRLPVLTAFLMQSAPAAAAVIPGSFKQIDCEGGGWFEQIVPHGSGRLYGRTDVGGLYRSDDHGDSWRFLSGDFTTAAAMFVQGVAVAAANADIVYQCTGTSYAADDPSRGIWKSTDGGAAWAQILTGVNFSGNDAPHWGGECIVVHPSNDAEIWAGTRGDGLRRSTDSGGSWTNVAASVFDTPNVVFCGITIHPSAPDHLWVCGEGGVWVSVDHGVSWTKKITATRIYRVARKPDGTTFAAGVNSGSNVLYRITAADWNAPAGYTVTSILPAYNAALPYPPSGEMATVQVMANGDVWAADLFEFTCRSSNNGASFTRMPMTMTGTLPAWSIPGTTTLPGGRNGIIQDPSNQARLFLGGGYAPFRSDNSGASWRYIANGVGETVAWRAVFHPADPRRVWLPIADLGVTTVSDGGDSGVSNGYIAQHFPWPDDNVIFSHRPLVSAGKVIAPGGEQSTHKARIYQTTNNGAGWSKLAAAGLPAGSGYEIIDAVADSANADDFIVFCAGTTGPGAAGIYRTVNGGASFTQASGLPAGFNCGDEFYWHPSLDRDGSNGAVRYLLLRNQGFYKSTDRGATWTRPSVQPRNTYSRLKADPVTGRVWVGTEFSTGFDYTDNGGTSWQPHTGFTSVTEFDCHGGRLAVIGRRSGDTFNRIYYSGDNAVTWNEISRAGFRFANAQAVAVDPWQPGTVWISTNGRAVARFRPWSPAEIWTNQYFGAPGPAGDAAWLADPDHDSLGNAVEYALGSDPRVFNPPPAAATIQIGAERFFALRAVRNGLPAGVTLSVEASADNEHWTTGGLTVVTDTASELLVRETQPAPVRRFLRLKAVIP